MALTDYSMMEREIEDAPEPKTLPRGAEVKARIIAVREGVSDKNDAHWYQPVFDVPADITVKEFNAFFWDLVDIDKLEGGRDGKQALGAMRGFKNFASCFNIDYSRPFDWLEDLIGKEGWVILGVKKSDEYGDQNTISKYIVKR